VLENDRAVGAVAGGRELITESIVLTASAYGSPAILLRSGIGPADDLARQGIPVVAELPVGQGLTDHVGTGAAWEPTEKLQTETAAFEREYPLFMGQVTLGRRSRSCEPGVRDLFLFPAAEAADGGYEISAAAFAMKPRSRGSVRLTARDAEAPLATFALGRVVDERCRVLGFENLHVADASVMPTIPRSNTHLSTIAIAERAAQWI
jgi:choline dehydrogenase